MGCSKGDLLLHSWGTGTGKCHRWDKQEKMREKREKSDNVLLSAFISRVGTSPGRGYLGGICPSALPVQSHKGLTFPSLSKELGSEISGEADTTREVKEKKTQPPWVPPPCPALTFVPHCHPALPELGWALWAPVLQGRGMAARGGSRGRLRIRHFHVERAGLASGSSLRL